MTRLRVVEVVGWFADEIGFVRGACDAYHACRCLAMMDIRLIGYSIAYT